MKQILKKPKNKINIIFQNFMKKILIIAIVTTNIFCYLPTVSCAASDEDEKVPATVPAVANEIISKFVSVRQNRTSSTGQSTNNNGGTANYTGGSTNYAEEGDGYHQLIEVANKRYKDYKQYEGSYSGDSYWGGTIASDGCGLTSCAIVLSGYGVDVDPGDVCERMKSEIANYTNSGNLSSLLTKYGISNERKSYVNFSDILNDIRNNLQAGRPVLVGINGTSDGTYSSGGHWMVILGESDGHIITANPGRNSTPTDDTLDNFINTQMSQDCAYILITQNYNGGSSSSSSNNGNSNSSNNTNQNNNSSHSSNNNNTSQSSSVNRQASIDDNYNINNGGYSSIFTSGTTGRQFKEYKQNIDGWDSRYVINNLQNSSGWRTECGTVSVMILGSGYTQNANFDNATQKLRSSNGNSQLVQWLSEYTGQNIDSLGSLPSKQEFINKLTDGCVAIVHSSDSRVSSSGSHYMSVLDISNDKTKVYLSNPWNGDSTNGWLSIDTVYGLLDSIAFVTNDGTSVDYGNTGTNNDNGNGGTYQNSANISSVNMSSNIVENGHNGYKININLDDEIDEMLETLKEKDFNLEKYISISNQKIILKNFIKAAIVTQYPDLRSASEIARNSEIPANETQGCIKVKRYVDDNTVAFAGNNLYNPRDNQDNSVYLSYKPYNEFSQLIQNGEISALNYFSLNSNNCIVVAGWETSDVDISIEQIDGEPDPNPDSAPAPRNQEYVKLTEKSINYISQITNYTVPFSFMWSLLVYGHDEDFVNDFAKLVIDTDIVIGSYDSTNVRTTTYTYTYVKTVEVHTTAAISTEEEVTNTRTERYTYRVTEHHILKTDTPSLKIKYANTWAAIYNNNYRIVEDTEAQDSSTTFANERISNDNHLYQNEGEVRSVINENEELGQSVEERIEQLKTQTHEYNQEKFAYRYEIISDIVSNISGEQGELLRNEDVQNYLINMIILGNEGEYVQNTFQENEVIERCAKEINEIEYRNIEMDAATTASLIVAVSKESEDEEDSLKNQLTKNGQDTMLNKTYSATVAYIQEQDETYRQDQQETVHTDIINSRVETITNSNNNVTLKIDKNSDVNSFVKLLSKSEKASLNLKIIDLWFFASMEKTAAIADMVDTVKCLCQYAYDKNYGYSQENIQQQFNPEEMSQPNPEEMTHVNRPQLTGGSVEEQVWNYLTSVGFSDASAAGILGNLQVESYVDPTFEGDAAGGIACFEKGTGGFADMQAYAASKGKEWTDLQCQLDYLISGLPSTFNTYTGLSPYYYDTGEWCWWPTAMTFDEYKTLTDPEEAAEIFCRVYERPSITHLDRRQDYARQYYNMYHGQ